jgi:hypothetical protein
MNAISAPTTDVQPGLLRRALQADAVVVGAAGALLALAAGPLGDLLDLPVSLLRITGIALFPWAAFTAFVATRDTVPRWGAWSVVTGNLVWVLASLLLLVSGWVDPSTLGVVFVIVQAAMVSGFAGLQFASLRRAR